MKFLAIEKELKLIDGNNKAIILAEEARAVFELYKRGIIREIYFNENNCAVIVLESDSIAHCKSILDKLPLVDEGYITFNIMELKPYTGLDRLMG
jgi:hypothetical protein